MTCFPGPRKPDHSTPLGVSVRRQTREMAERVTKEEGDRIAASVLELVRLLAAERVSAPVVDRDREPTGITYAPDMRQYVEQRSGERVA